MMLSRGGCHLSRHESRGPARADLPGRCGSAALVETLREAGAKTGWQVHAYVLMPNHFHLVVETPQPNLVAGMKWFLGTYTSRFNRRHKLFGHLFSGRYKSLVVDGSGSGYLRRRLRVGFEQRVNFSADFFAHAD